MSNELVQVFPCGDEKCAGTAIPVAKEGRYYHHKDREWLTILIPADFLIHRCNVCSRDWLDEANQKKVADFLEASYQEHASLIAVIVEEYRVRTAKQQQKKGK